MRLKFLTALFALAFLAACGTDGTDNSNAAAGGAGGDSAAADPNAGAAGAGGLATDTGAGDPLPDIFVRVGDRVFFGYDSFTLTPEAQDVLQAQARFLAQYPNVTITIEGHCDERGTREYNLALGERRANAVRDYLVALGIDPNRVGTISYGKERPAVIGSGDEVWAQNRRSVTVLN